MKRILASDYLIADVIVHLKKPSEIEALRNTPGVDQQLLNKYEQLNQLIFGFGSQPGGSEIRPGGKYTFEPKNTPPDVAQQNFARFSDAVAGLPQTVEPGGSSANTLTALTKLMEPDGEKPGPEVTFADFIGVAGTGMHSTQIEQALQKARINRLPKTLPADPIPEGATSLVFVMPEGWYTEMAKRSGSTLGDAELAEIEKGGRRAIITRSGNAREIITPEVLHEDMVKNADVLLVQGALWEKFGPKNADPKDVEYANMLMKLRRQYDKELILTLPTKAEFSSHFRVREHFQFIMASADVVASNNVELMRIFDTHDMDDALHRLQDKLNERDRHVREWGGRHRDRPAVGFITNGGEGAYIVTADHRRADGSLIEGGKGKIIPVKAPHISKDDFVNDLGAGDTSFAGFIAGYLKGLDFTQSAQIAAVLAGETLKVNGPRLEDPKRSLREAAPELAPTLLGPATPNAAMQPGEDGVQQQAVRRAGESP